MSTQGVIVRVEMGIVPCPCCFGPTIVQKSDPRNVVTLEHGGFVAYETVRICAARCRHPSGTLVTVRSENLSRLVPAGGVFGYDVEVFVGLARFVHHKQREEIRAELAKKGITPSSGEISALALRFLKHLAELHASRQPALREAIERDGGYPLNFDATGEDGRGTLLVAYDGWREWVLGAWKLPTERADQITPHLVDVAERFGLPCALMRDLGRAVRRAANYYVKIVCGSLEKLPDAFADLDIAKRSLALGTIPSERTAVKDEPRADFASLPRADRRVVRAESLRQRIDAAARSRAPRRLVALG